MQTSTRSRMENSSRFFASTHFKHTVLVRTSPHLHSPLFLHFPTSSRPFVPSFPRSRFPKSHQPRIRHLATMYWGSFLSIAFRSFCLCVLSSLLFLPSSPALHPFCLSVSSKPRNPSSLGCALWTPQ